MCLRPSAFVGSSDACAYDKETCPGKKWRKAEGCGAAAPYHTRQEHGPPIPPTANWAALEDEWHEHVVSVHVSPGSAGVPPAVVHTWASCSRSQAYTLPRFYHKPANRQIRTHPATRCPECEQLRFCLRLTLSAFAGMMLMLFRSQKEPPDA